jgi:hypothetical protein
MPYDSPKQIRRRQQERQPRRTRKPAPIRVASREEWDRACDFHLDQIRTNSNYPETAGRHARALVTMAIYRRAAEVMLETGTGHAYKAVNIARVEMLGLEAA